MINKRMLFSIFRYPKAFMKFKNYGNNLRFGPNGSFARSQEISFGNNIYIGPNFHISARKLEFKNSILIGPNFLLEGEDHIFSNIGQTIWQTRSKKDTGYNTIEDDVWIGGNVTVLKNVTIGEGCIVGAGSVITKSLPPYTICVGVPCRPIKLRFPKDDLKKHLSMISSEYSIEKVLNSFKKS